MSVKDKVRSVDELRQNMIDTHGLQLSSTKTGMKINRDVAKPVVRLMRMRLVSQITNRIDSPDHSKQS